MKNVKHSNDLFQHEVPQTPILHEKPAEDREKGVGDRVMDSARAAGDAVAGAARRVAKTVGEGIGRGGDDGR